MRRALGQKHTRFRTPRDDRDQYRCVAKADSFCGEVRIEVMIADRLPFGATRLPVEPRSALDSILWHLNLSVTKAFREQ